METALRAVDQAVTLANGRWFLFGAQAVAVHGVPRTTKDIDVTVMLPGADVEPLRRALKRAKFHTRKEDEPFLATSRVLPTVHTPSGWRVDVVLGGPGLEQHLLEQAQVMKLGRLKVHIIRPEHLVVLKCLAGRPRDLEDVRGVIGANRQFDVDEVRRLIAMLQTEIADSEILPLFERLLGESTRAI